MDVCNAELNVWLILHNSVLFGGKLLSNEKSNAFEFCNVDGGEMIEICQKSNSWSTFWGYKSFKPAFFHPTKISFEIKTLNLTQINIEIQFTREMCLKSCLETALVSSVKVYFTLSGWTRCNVCRSRINKLITCFMQYTMKLTVIWLLWLSIINKCFWLESFGWIFGSKIKINYLNLWESNVQLLLLVKNFQFESTFVGI